MKYNIDSFPNRYGTSCFKWDGMASSFGPEARYPLFVADMDFESAPEIIDALRKRVDHKVFGYTSTPEDYLQAVVDWEKNQHRFPIEKDWILFSPGVVPAIFWIVTNFSQPGENVLVFKPVYNPFFNAIEKQGRKIVSCDLDCDENGYYTINFEKMEKTIVDSNIKLMIFCSPHNPVGRCWTKEELEQVIAICKKHNVLIVSDEIHQDIVFKGHTHIPTASIAGDYANNIFTVTAATKTFNLAGLQNSILIISDPEKRQIIKDYQTNTLEMTGGNLLGYTAVTAAYTRGIEWMHQMLDYVWDNYCYLVDFCKNNLPMLKITPLEATYLAWVNCKELKMDDDALREFLIKDCGIAANMGNVYGQNGEGYIRLNLGCPRYILQEALQSMYNAVKAKGLC